MIWNNFQESNEISLAELRLKNDLVEISPSRQVSLEFSILRSDICKRGNYFYLKITMTKKADFDKSVLVENNNESINKLFIEFYFSQYYPYEVPFGFLLNFSQFTFPFISKLNGQLNINILLNWNHFNTLNNVISEIEAEVKNYEIYKESAKFHIDSYIFSKAEELSSRILITNPLIQFKPIQKECNINKDNPKCFPEGMNCYDDEETNAIHNNNVEKASNSTNEFNYYNHTDIEPNSSSNKFNSTTTENKMIITEENYSAINNNLKLYKKRLLTQLIYDG